MLDDINNFEAYNWRKITNLIVMKLEKDNELNCYETGGRKRT
jgi:hypothetical protein